MSPKKYIQSAFALFFIVGTFLYAVPASAYVVLYNSGSTGVATSSGGGNALTWSNGSTMSWIIIDCEALGWSEIASTTLELDTVSGSIAFQLRDDAVPQFSNENYTITTTQAPKSYTFTPPLWCEGRKVVFNRHTTTGGSVRTYGHNSLVPLLKGSYTISGPSTNNTLQGSNTLNNLPSMIIVGSYSTSTPATGGGTTTVVYELYPVSTTTDLSASTVQFPFLIFFTVLATMMFVLRYVWGIK